MSASFTYYIHKSEFVWLKAIDAETSEDLWLRVRDVDQVATEPFSSGGRVSVRVKGKAFKVPHRCDDQTNLDKAVHQLLEASSSR